MLGESRQWSFSRDGAESTVRVNGPLRSNNGELLCRAAVEGLGLIRASELEVACEQRTGKLVQVLAEYEVATNAALWALYPSAKHLLPRMRALLDFLADWFREASSGGRASAVGTLAVVPDGAAVTVGAARTKVQLRAG
jgi:DNA-binding transcriptional LysR family regulator